MASYVYGSGVPYGKYLQDNAYVRDITGQIIKRGDATRQEISSQTREIVASNEKLSQEFGAGFDAVNGTLEFGFDRVENALGNVEASIENLHSDFNYNMGLVLDQLQIQNQLTFGILERLDAIHKTLEHPELTKAREFYKRGCDRLSKGLLEKALEAFLKSEEINDTDFFTQFQIGKLYLYGINEDDNVIDLQKAEHYLRYAARYGKAELSALPEFNIWTGEALLHASIACYAQANDHQISGNNDKANDFISEAFKLAQQACDIYPLLSESQYHFAKYAALLGKLEISLQSLEKAINSDVNYCLKVDFDQDFNNIRSQVFDLFEQLRVKMRDKAISQVDTFSEKYILNIVYLSDEAKKNKNEFKNILSNIKILIDKDAILDIYDSLRILEEIELKFLVVYNKFIEKYSIDEEIYDISNNIIATKSGNLMLLSNGSLIKKLPVNNLVNLDATNINFSPDGNLISTHQENNATSELYKINNGKLLFTFPGVFKRFSPDGKIIATSDGTNVRLWKINNGELIRTFSGRFCEFSPDGKIIGIENSNGNLNLWQVNDGGLYITLNNAHELINFNNNGKLIATKGDKKILIWQVSDGRLLYELPDEEGWCRFSPDGNYIATFNYLEIGSSVKIWKVSNGRLLRTLKGNHAIFNPDGNIITEDFNITFWRVNDGKQLNILKEKRLLYNHNLNFILTYDGENFSHVKVWERQIISKKEHDQLKLLEDMYSGIANKHEINKSSNIQKRTSGICSVCGAKLSFFDNLRGRTTCSKHTT